ncbi:MAG: sodium-dependent bicarbonate transport family permease [Pseudomonadota bacterium]
MAFDAVILFFILGIILKLFNPSFVIPQGLSKALIIILLIAIGLKGGLALKENFSLTVVYQCFIVMIMGFLLPLLAYPVLRFFGRFSTVDAACMAAHYGSVSVATYAVAISYLGSQNILFEEYLVLLVVVLEVPAIVTGLLIVGKKSNLTGKQLIGETFGNASIILLIGALLIGFLSNDSINKTLPLFSELFTGILAIFLLEMGTVAATQLKSLRKNSVFVVSFAVFMPLVAAVIGAFIASTLLSLSQGGTMILITLAASASYIAVPAAMRVALPDANHGLSIAASLGITFPFNVIVGIPIYHSIATALTN